MKVLLVSEGIHESSGALEALVRRALPMVGECEFRRVKDSRFRAHHGKGSGVFKRAVAWMLEARADAFDAMVMVIDEDGDPDRVTELTMAQDETERSGDMRRAIGVAIRTFDTWMLADEIALTNILRCEVDRHRAPEKEREPKRYCKDVLELGRNPMALRDLYAQVSEQLDLDRLSERCPEGFGEFLRRLRALRE